MIAPLYLAQLVLTVLYTHFLENRKEKKKKESWLCFWDVWIQSPQAYPCTICAYRRSSFDSNHAEKENPNNWRHRRPKFHYVATAQVPNIRDEAWHGCEISVSSKWVDWGNTSMSSHSMPWAWTVLGLTIWGSWGNVHTAQSKLVVAHWVADGKKSWTVGAHSATWFGVSLPRPVLFVFQAVLQHGFRKLFHRWGKRKVWSPVVHIKLFRCETRKWFYRYTGPGEWT